MDLILEEYCPQILIIMLIQFNIIFNILLILTNITIISFVIKSNINVIYSCNSFIITFNFDFNSINNIINAILTLTTPK